MAASNCWNNTSFQSENEMGSIYLSPSCHQAQLPFKIFKYSNNPHVRSDFICDLRKIAMFLKKHVCIPIGSMHGIYANIGGGIFMVNVTIYSIHGSYGI